MVSCPYCHVVLPWPNQQQNVPRQAPQQPYYQQQPSGQGQQYQQQAQQAYPNMEYRYEQPKEKEKTKKKNPWLIGCGIVAGIVAFIVIIVAISSSSGPSLSTPSSSSAPAATQVPAIEINAVALYTAYQGNPIAADAKYKDKILKVSGTIVNIDKSTFGTPYIIFGMDVYGISGVMCEFNKTEETNLINLKIGQSATVQGICKGYSALKVDLEDCTLVQ